MPDPTGAKRFYEAVVVAPSGEGFAILLDGRGTRTPGRAPLLLPTRELADAVADEWRDQGERIVPATMPLTRLANTAIDGVAPEMEAVRADIARYAGSDLVMYRAADPERLVAAQSAAWDPVLAWARERFGARFVLSEGVIFVDQPPESLARIGAALEAVRSPFGLAALHVTTTLTGSVLVALMHAAGALDAEAAWRAAHVDELHQETQWGQDLEALRRREAREAEFRAASRLHALARV